MQEGGPVSLGRSLAWPRRPVMLLACVDILLWRLNSWELRVSKRGNVESNQTEFVCQPFASLRSQRVIVAFDPSLRSELAKMYGKSIFPD